MKLIIDIPEDVYTRLFDKGIQDNEIEVDDVCEMARALRLGTPLEQEPKTDILDKIRAEIAKIQLIGYATVNGKREIASRAVMQILDKYKAESEDKE